MGGSAKPKVSVLMSAWNAEGTLQRSIRSVLGQSFSDFEFIIVDDGSEDATRSVVAEHAEKDARVVPVYLDSNGGLTAALNLALERARGELIARQDADDASLPGRFERQVELLEGDKEIGVCGTRFWVCSEDLKPVFSVDPPEADADIRRLIERGTNPLAHGTAMFRRSALDALPEPRYRFRYGQDFDLWARLADAGAGFRVIPEELYLYRRGTESTGAGVSAVRAELKALMLALMEERRSGGGEKRDWRSEEERIVSGLDVASGRRMKSYSRAWLELLRGNRAEAGKAARSASGWRARAVGALAFLPFGTALARRLHEHAYSKYSGVKWADGTEDSADSADNGGLE